jgi:lipopolysaccharide/colanic/teichoic acid biosynthesis glycosyltransferase
VSDSGTSILGALKKKSGGFLRRLFHGSRPPRRGEEVEPTANGSNHSARQGESASAVLPARNHPRPPSWNGHTDVSPVAETLANRFRRSWYAYLKWAFDFTLALIILILTAPLSLLAMLLVKLTSRGPALYSQTRVGLDGRPFTIYKIRSMTHQCESLTGARWSTPGDSRVTPVGRILRKTHIDELPQLWNVLRGDMSLIGPRPERPEFVPQLEKALPLYRVRLLVRPGVTGLAQVQLPPDTNLDSVRVKLAYDVWYVRQVSFFLDLRILFATASKLFGLPFGVIRALFGFARKETIQQAYGDLTTVADRSAPTRAQTA